MTTYILGKHPVWEEFYKWWEIPLIKIGLKNRRYKTELFKLTLAGDYFEIKDVLSFGTPTTLQIVDKPHLTFWSHVAKFFGMKYRAYKYNVQIK